MPLLKSSAILVGQAVNKAHPINKGLAAWLLALPGRSGSRWLNLLNLNHGTLVGGAVWGGPNGRLGGLGSIALDGTTGYVDFTDATLFSFPDASFTVSQWVKTTSVAANTYLINKRHTTGSASGWMIRMNADGTTTCRIIGNASDVAAERISVATVNNGLQRLVTAMFTTDTVTGANNVINVYIDGLLSQGTLTQSGSPYLANTADSVKVGVQSDLLAATYWTGAVDDIRIYNRALTGPEVWQLYQLSRQGYPGVLNRMSKMGVAVTSTSTPLAFSGSLTGAGSLKRSVGKPLAGVI